MTTSAAAVVAMGTYTAKKIALLHKDPVQGAIGIGRPFKVHMIGRGSATATAG